MLLKRYSMVRHLLLLNIIYYLLFNVSLTYSSFLIVASSAPSRPTNKFLKIMKQKKKDQSESAKQRESAKRNALALVSSKDESSTVTVAERPTKKARVDNNFTFAVTNSYKGEYYLFVYVDLFIINN